MQAVHKVSAKGICRPSVLWETGKVEPGTVQIRAPLFVHQLIKHILVLCLKVYIGPLGGSFSEDGYRAAWRWKERRCCLSATSCHFTQQLKRHSDPYIRVEMGLVLMFFEQFCQIFFSVQMSIFFYIQMGL